MPSAITSTTPFPSVDGIGHDALSLRIIAPAYASPTGELNAVLQYIYHSFYFEKCGKEKTGETLVGIAVAEMLHLRLLGKTVLALGAPPVYCQCPYSCFNFYSAKYVSYSRSLKEMIEDDLIGERRAASSYEGMLRKLKNDRVKEIVSRILEDEKMHICILEEILRDFSG